MGKGNYRVRVNKRTNEPNTFDVIKYFWSYNTAMAYYEYVSGSNYIADISERINLQWRVFRSSGVRK